MKNFGFKILDLKVSIIAAGMLAMFAHDANAAAQQLIRLPGGGYRVVYQYEDKPEYGQWYVGLKYVQNFLSAGFTYTIDGGQFPYDDNISFASQPGGSIVVGNKFAKHWRAEAEVGYSGVYSETEVSDLGYGNVNIEFKTSAPYAEANVIYDFTQNEYGGFYIGGGLGVAMPNTKIIAPSVFVNGNDESETSTSFLGAFLFGWQKTLREHLMLDVGAKIWTYKGTRHTREWRTGSPTTNHTFTNDMGWSLNTAVTLGLKYVF